MMEERNIINHIIEMLKEDTLPDNLSEQYSYCDDCNLWDIHIAEIKTNNEVAHISGDEKSVTLTLGELGKVIEVPMSKEEMEELKTFVVQEYNKVEDMDRNKALSLLKYQNLPF